MSEQHSAPLPPEVVDILRLAPGGEGIAHRGNGEVLFVAATAPGDRVEVGEFSRQAGALRGRLLKIITPSPDRREPPCPYANTCGGCDFMHLTPEAQRREKLALLDDALRRIAGDPQRPSSVEVVDSKAQSGYRCRLRLHVDKHGQVGMLSARSHRVVPIERCLVADDAINAAITQLAAASPTDKKRLSFCEQLELRSAETSPLFAVRLFARQKSQLRPDLYAPLFPADAAVVVAGSKQDDESTQCMAVTPELTLRVPLSAFSQVHRAVNQALVRAVVEAATRRDRHSFLDAYAGAGNFAIPLLQAGLTGEAVDSAGAGILAARGLARDLGLPFAGFGVGDAKKLLDHFVKSRRKFDFIVLDPPRRGAKSVLDEALRLRPRTLALIGCDPVSLARDLATLTAQGGRIESLTLFDMFPETHHSETLAIVDCAE
jgi:23S rRNA (uracil1939-C5)-methyltransferase